jgi:undecaprenyl-diphosphatase
MLSAVVYLTLGALLARATPAWRHRVYIVTIAIFFSLLIGITRIYLGVHYPTDVMAGWLIGFVWAVGWALVTRALERRGLAPPSGTPQV